MLGGLTLVLVLRISHREAWPLVFAWAASIVFTVICIQWIWSAPSG